MTARKHNKLLLVLLIVILIIMILCSKLKAPADKSQTYRNMIYSAFGISLSETNSNLVYANTILSRDSVYIVSFSLSDDFIIEELKKENGWKNDFEFILPKYIIPYEKYFSDLNLIIKSSQMGQCYYKLVILNERTESFELVIVNPSEKDLFFFYLTT